MQAVSISLSVFRAHHPIAIFWSKIAFFRFCRAFMRNVQDKPGESYFLPNRNLIAIKQLQTAQTAHWNIRFVDIIAAFV